MKRESKNPRYDSNWSRRDFLKSIGLLGGGLSIAGLTSACNSGNKSGPAQLKLYGTATLNIEDLPAMPDGKPGPGWHPLLESNNLEIKFVDNLNDTGPILTQMLRGTAAMDYDLGAVQGGLERELAAARKIIPWDISKIPNYQNIWPLVKTKTTYTTIDNAVYGIPMVVNADSMIYLPDKTGGVIDSYEALFGEQFRGKVAMEDAWINSVIFAAIYLKENKGLSIGDPANLSPDELTQVMTFLIDLKKKGHFVRFWKGWDDAVQLLRSGQVYVMTGWEPIAYALMNDKVQPINAAYATPKEGWEGWSNDLLLHAGAENRNSVSVAHAFANWQLSGYYGAVLATRGLVVPTNASRDYAANPVGGKGDLKFGATAEVFTRVQKKFEGSLAKVYFQNVRPTNLQKYEEWWSKLRGV